MIRTSNDAGTTWRRVVEAAPDAGLAHAPEWLPIIQRVYGHDPVYLSAEDDDGGRAVLPAFVVRRPFFGAVVTSMPFLDSGGPSGSSPALKRILVEHLIAEARRIGAKSIELRSSGRLDIGGTPAEHKVNMTLAIPEDVDRLWRQTDKDVRNQVRKAERSGLTIECGGVERLAAFYDIFAVRMRDLGSPVHAAGFLAAVLAHFGSRARVLIALKGRLAVGGLIAIAFKDRLTVPWASCLKEYFPLCPNMLLYWEALRRACVEGFRQFDFGRSSRDSGTYRFKAQWGAHEEPLFWYTIPTSTRLVDTSVDRRTSVAFLSRTWQHLPLSLTRQVGPRLRGYLIQ
ncbi:MAG TPA: GNAT family N-acetyltransferase [Vicinamibacterales bacterium]|jgi:FemAB-related protein (PEP-CTERM system-associated)|nr:GNAT family N-acetyltransferase [Vicinamibacterales bacterium]